MLQNGEYFQPCLNTRRKGEEKFSSKLGGFSRHLISVLIAYCQFLRWTQVCVLSFVLTAIHTMTEMWMRQSLSEMKACGSCRWEPAILPLEATTKALWAQVYYCRGCCQWVGKPTFPACPNVGSSRDLQCQHKIQNRWEFHLINCSESMYDQFKQLFSGGAFS